MFAKGTAAAIAALIFQAPMFCAKFASAALRAARYTLAVLT
jgi:hypothetical protein